MNCSTPGLPVHRQLPQFTQTHVHWVGDAIQPSHPLSSLSVLFPSLFLSITVFSTESALRIRWPKDWSFSFSTSFSLSNEYSDWFPLGLTGLISLQSKGLSRFFSNTTVQNLQCSAFFMVQLSHPYMTTGKTIVLTRWTFVGQVMTTWPGYVNFPEWKQKRN